LTTEAEVIVYERFLFERRGYRTNKASPFRGIELHEYAVTESILEIVQSEAEQAGGGRVDEITLVIGELTNFVDESIEFYFGELSRGTLAEGADLRFQKVEAKAVCSSCHATFKPKHAFFVCPECGSAVFELTQGNELYIDNIEVTQ
jgi:hydrogenase nickel incorporation protein HypA/HybF